MTPVEPPPLLQETYRFRRGAWSETTRIDREPDGVVWWSDRPQRWAQQIAALLAGAAVIAGGIWGSAAAFGPRQPLAVLCGFLSIGGGLLLAFRLSPERHTLLCTDEATREVALFVRPEGMAPFLAAHVLLAPDGRVVGRIVKSRWSMGSWRLLGPSGEEIGRAVPEGIHVPTLLGALAAGLLMLMCCVLLPFLGAAFLVQGRVIRSYRLQAGERVVGSLKREGWGSRRATLTALPDGLPWEFAAVLGVLAARDWRGTL